RSLVCQLAQLAGGRAVGIAGGPAKCAYVQDELRFDAAIDHRDPDFSAQLTAACPNGIDVYFENVGGVLWQAVLPLLNTFARVPVCGLIAHYNGVGTGDGTDRLPATMRAILSKSLTVRGFINTACAAEHSPAFLREVGAGIADGRIRYREDFVDGLEQAPAAFLGLLEGRNFGKLIVRVDAQRQDGAAAAHVRWPSRGRVVGREQCEMNNRRPPWKDNNGAYCLALLSMPRVV